MKRVALGVAYDGRPYSGFQVQPGLETVQKYLLLALEQVAGHKLQMGCAGRTDTGVHALCQVVHIETSSEREMAVWVRGANALLPDTIQVLWAQEVGDDFHARFSAKSRSYIYYLSDSSPHLFESPYIWQVKALDVEKMDRMGKRFLGEQDFRMFQSKICQSPISFRDLKRLDVRRQGNHVRVDITANAFLHRMVRKMVSALVAVGQGRMSEEVLYDAFLAGDRSQIPGQAPAKALFLSDVCYGGSILVSALDEFIG